MSQVSSSVTDLDNMTQQNAALVEQSASAAEGLRQRARDLLTVLQGFRLEQQEQAAQPRTEAGRRQPHPIG